jgi:hypothetical protein
LLFSGGYDLSVGNAAAAGSGVAHAVIFGGVEVEDGVLLGLVGDSAIAHSIELVIDN